MTKFFLGLQVMDLVAKQMLVLEERRISLSEFHTADEVYTYICLLGFLSSTLGLRTLVMY